MVSIQLTSSIFSIDAMQAMFTLRAICPNAHPSGQSIDHLPDPAGNADAAASFADCVLDTYHQQQHHRRDNGNSSRE